MGNFDVIQRTKDSYFNATALLKQWNEFSGHSKQMSHFTDNNSTEEFIKAIMQNEGLKERKSVLIQARGKNGGTWMHPLLFIDFAMWLNPTFKLSVLKFVRDEMIKFRNLAGDAYPSMCRAIATFVPKEHLTATISKIAKALNIIIYGVHEHEQRNKIGDENKIRELYELEKDVATWINMGFIKDYNGLKDALRKLYVQKHPQKLPI